MADADGPVVRWLWAFVDAPGVVAPSVWEFWRAVARARLSPTRGDHGQFATLLPARGDPWLKVQMVGSGGGVHLDLEVPDPGGTAETAVGLGASVIGRLHGDRVVVMRSPGGFAFCLTSWTGPAAGRQVRVGEPDLVDQVCLDIPGPLFESETAFWRDLTGLPYTASDLPEFGSLVRPSTLPLRLLFQRLDAGDGPVRGHLDLACTDRVATVARHVGLGARVVREHPFWTVLADPGGAVYCVTDRTPVPAEASSTE